MPLKNWRGCAIKKDKSIAVVIPCRNEEKFIGKCLDSLIESDFPKDKLEVFVVDGMSDDGTRQLVKNYTKKFPFIKLISNDKKVTPVAMNMGIKAADSQYVIILSSHSQIDRQFLRLNLEGFEKYTADCVGGVIITLPANKTLIAESIAFSLAHPFGVGNSHFRIGSKEPRFVDTVPFGCYKKETLQKIGLFDEELVRNQDDELNLRLLKRGGKLLLMPNITSYYHARDSLKKLWKMYYQYGYFKPLVARKVGGVLTWRQLMPALLVATVTALGLMSIISKIFFILFIFTISAYGIANLLFSIFLARRKGLKYLPVFPAVFATIHFSYGTGYIKGLWDFVIFKNRRRNKIEDVPMTR